MNFTEEKIALQISKNKNIPFCERQTAELCIFQVINNHARFIPSYERQVSFEKYIHSIHAIHPLLRGADHLCLHHWIVFCRFITSCEGQTFHTSHTTRHSQIHPLQRGANPQSAFRHLLLYEKSPPARGKLAAIRHVWHNFRIIPSYEGQTCLVYVDKMTNAIHPLIRGANVQFLSWILFVIDSSPHTRGKQFVFFRNFPTIRFIPSREGKTSANPRGKVRAKIHPLPRGENPQCLWGF